MVCRHGLRSGCQRDPMRKTWSAFPVAARCALVVLLFGLGFFIHFIGGNLDRALGYEELHWAQPGLLWASLTLAVLEYSLNRTIRSLGTHQFGDAIGTMTRQSIVELRRAIAAGETVNV